MVYWVKKVQVRVVRGQSVMVWFITRVDAQVSGTGICFFYSALVLVTGDRQLGTWLGLSPLWCPSLPPLARGACWLDAWLPGGLAYDV